MAEREPLVLGGAVALEARRHGLKAQALDAALRQGERVPPAFALPTELALLVAQRDPAALLQLEAALQQLRGLARDPGEAPTLAVRASPTQSLPGALLTRLDVPDDLESVARAVAEVFESSLTPALRDRRVAEGLPEPHAPWVGVLVQRQLRFAEGDFGAVAFTHDTHTGAPRLHGEFAARGVVDVVSGRTQPRPLQADAAAPGQGSLSAERPLAWEAIASAAQRLSDSFERPLDLELALCGGTLWLLQARPLTFSARALVRLALTAIEQDSPRYADWLRELARRGLHGLVERHFVDTDPPQASAMRGLAASPGAARGILVTDVQRAQQLAREQPIVLVRPDAVPEDIATFRRAEAIVTSSGGLTCHAAVIARGLGIPAVVGVAGVRVDVPGGVLWGGRDGRQAIAREGDWLSVDARRGLVYPGRLALEARIHDPELRRLFAEARKLRPSPLWVRGPVLEALRVKNEASLDGALCSWPAQGELPPGEGRECWVEIDAADLDARLALLPRGWGVVVVGATGNVSVASLRQRFPLRAWGMRFDDEHAAPADAPLDLAVFGAHLPPDAAQFSQVLHGSFQKRVRAARLLHEVNFSGELPVPDGNNVGWVCPVSTVALTALGYAAQRARHARGVVG